MKKTLLTAAVLAAVSLNSCMTQETEKFDYNVDRFADIQVLRYQVPGFEQLTLNQKIYVYYLTEAAIYGRDILFDQHGKYNLQIRKLLENIYQNYSGDKNSADYAAMVKYLKQVWFANGIHHHYSTDKFVPEFSQEFFAEQVKALPADKLPLNEGETAEQMIETLSKVIFDPAYMQKRVNQADGQDLVLTSANNLYEGVTQKEVEDYYRSIKDVNDSTPISYGLNAKVIKVDGKVQEQQ